MTAKKSLNKRANASQNVSVNKASIHDYRKKSFRIARINKKERIKQMKRLLLSTAENEEEDFIEN